MIGASPAAFAHCEPIFRTLAPEGGYAQRAGGAAFSRDDQLEESFGAKVIAALRHEFGGHTLQTK